MVVHALPAKKTRKEKKLVHLTHILVVKTNCIRQGKSQRQGCDLGGREAVRARVGEAADGHLFPYIADDPAGHLDVGEAPLVGHR